MVKIIKPETPDQWNAYYQLRYDTLRKPWNQPPGSEKDEIESQCIHLFAMSNELPAGVCRIQYNSDKEAQIRFMGVSAQLRGKKIGHKLLEEAEKIVLQNGRSYITLQAREEAVKFYESAGYKIVEKTFFMWDQIQHYRMNKTLN
jgi:predicted GNAT family N-acyltransferase